MIIRLSTNHQNLVNFQQILTKDKDLINPQCLFKIMLLDYFKILTSLDFRLSLFKLLKEQVKSKMLS